MKQILYSCMLFLALVSNFTQLKGQTCCTNEVYINNGFETTGTKTFRFPNNTLQATNNAVSMASNGSNTLGGWFLGTPNTTVTPGYVVTDATRASEGAQFWYLPRATTNTGADNSICIQNATQLTSNATCNTYNIKVGKRYVAAIDFVAFNVSAPAGGVGVSQPVFEYATVTATSFAYDRLTFFDANGVTIPNMTSVNWDDVKTSWKRGWLTFTGKPNYQYVAYSTLESATTGALMDNTSIKEIAVTAAGLGPTTCNQTSSSRVFTLNPVSNVGGVPDLKYTVTPPIGYMVTPTTGIYGQTTSFILTKNVGSAIGTGNLTIIIADEVNTECTVTATIPDVLAPSNVILAEVAAVCANGVSQNNGKIVLTSYNNADKVGFSTGSSYTGPVYAAATTITATPMDLITNVPNAGGTYTFRFFNGDNACFIEEVFTVAADNCTSCPTTNYQLCPNESYTLTTAPDLTNIQWFRNGNLIPGATSMNYIATQIGSYTYTADQIASGCSGSLCCPLEIVAGTMCCTISAANPIITCDDANTGSTPVDDYFTVTLNPTGAGIGTTYSVSGGITANNVPYGSAQQVGGNFLISGGNLSIIITDDASGNTCQLSNITINAPSPCSTPVDRPTRVPPGQVPPCHVINTNLRLGPTNLVDDSLQTIADDGLTVIPSIATPGATLNLEMEVFNTMGVNATLIGWVDWNGNGLLEAPSEQVILQAIGQGTTFVPVTLNIPLNVPQNVDIDAAFRISTQSSLGPYGEPCAPDGEYENYSFRFSCTAPICLPVTFTRN